MAKIREVTLSNAIERLRVVQNSLIEIASSSFISRSNHSKLMLTNEIPDISTILALLIALDSKTEKPSISNKENSADKYIEVLDTKSHNSSRFTSYQQVSDTLGIPKSTIVSGVKRDGLVRKRYKITTVGYKVKKDNKANTITLP